MVANIYIRISGGIGNQLFQVITAYRYAKEKAGNLYYFIDKVDHYGRDFLLADLLTKLDIRPYRMLHSKRCVTLNDLNFYDPKNLYQYGKNEDVILHGSFQNLEYIYKTIDAKKALIIEWLEDQTGNHSSQSFDNVVHFRLAHNKDRFLKAINDCRPLPAEFIAELINLSSIAAGEDIKVVSDIPSGSQVFKTYLDTVSTLIPNNRLIHSDANNDPLADLLCMVRAEKRLFCSNSTFSLWGGVLNCNARVYSPYLGNLELWASSPYKATQVYFDTRKYDFTPHVGACLEPIVSSSSPLARGSLRILSYIGIFLPFARRIRRRLERHFAKRSM